jgi:hypothetical protein
VGKRCRAANEMIKPRSLTVAAPGNTTIPPFDSRVNASIASLISAALLIPVGTGLTSNEGAAASIARRYTIQLEFPESKMTATRLTLGAISLMDWSHLLPIDCSKLISPVILPPPRALAALLPAKFGRKPKLNEHQRNEAVKRLRQGESARAVARIFNVHHATVSRLRA